MTFAEWQQLAPDEAARELLRRAQALPEAQRRAAIVRLPSAAELEARLAAAPSDTPLAGVPYFLKDLFDVAGEPERLKQGTPVMCNGYRGAIVRHYSDNMYEIRLPGGVTCTDDFEVIDESKPNPSPATV